MRGSIKNYIWYYGHLDLNQLAYLQYFQYVPLNLQ